MRYSRRKPVDIDHKEKDAPGATWKELRRDERRGVEFWLRTGLPVALGAVAGGLSHTGIPLGLGLVMGALVGITMVLIVSRVDIERVAVAIAAGTVGAATGAPAAAFLWIAVLPGFAPGILGGSVTGVAIGMAILAGFFGWLVGTLAGGFAALVIWGFMEFFG